MKIMKKILGGVAFFSLPAVAFAVPSGGTLLVNVEDLITSIGYLIGLLLPITVAAALLAFFWGLAKFIYKGGDEEAKKEGRQLMIWGVVALFVMVSIWGLVGFIKYAIFGSSNVNSLSPTIPTVRGLP
jgi:hypothetical protein